MALVCILFILLCYTYSITIFTQIQGKIFLKFGAYIHEAVLILQTELDHAKLDHSEPYHAEPNQGLHCQV